MMNNTPMKCLLMALTISATCSLNAQNADAPKPKLNYSISGKIKGLADTVVYLANYYGKQVYYNDTSRVDSKGNFKFEGKPYNECGKYMLLLPSMKRFDFIVADENIVLETDTSCNLQSLKVVESENNKIFFSYVRFIGEKMKSREPIDKILNDTLLTDKDKEPALDQLKKLNEEVVNYQKELIAKNPDLLVAKLIKLTIDITIPDAPTGLTDDEKKKWNYYYYRDHYWDNCDLTDPRMVRDQAFHKLIEKYVSQTLPQIPDTMTHYAKQLIDRTKGNEDSFKYIVHHFTYHFETSKIMCMDEGFVFMVDNYYSKDLCTWMKEDKLKAMKESAGEKRHCLCGEVGPNIILPDTNNVWQSMYDLNSKYTLLVIWEATCGHCKKEIPKLQELYHKWKDKGLEVYAVHNNLETDKWLKFLHDNNIDFTNVARNQFIMNQDSATKLIYGGKTTLESLNYHQYWDVNSTPKVYLMDKDHKVIAKSLGSEQLDELLQRLESGETDIAPQQTHEYEDEEENTDKGKGNVIKPRNLNKPDAQKNATPPHK
ncbi:MAG: redoxin domain-containing protein [Flavobacteriales bacterium]